MNNAVFDRICQLQRPSYRDSLSDIGCQSGLTLKGAKTLIQDHLRLIKDPITDVWYYGADRSSLSNWRYGLTRGHFEVFWPPGKVLAETMVRPPLDALLREKNVLSVGAGSGVAEIFLVKNCSPRLMACMDTNVFARAAIELNAAANDVQVGDTLITISHPDLLHPFADGVLNYRLYDTVLAADCLHGKESVRRHEAIDLVNTLRRLHSNGMDIVITERDTAESERRSGNLSRAALYEAAQVMCGLTDASLRSRSDVPIPHAELSRIGVSFGNRHIECVSLHHWPKAQASRPFPRLDGMWWKSSL
jgi:predicted nicotinamide N-methyase